jgi:hypothetical protein
MRLYIRRHDTPHQHFDAALHAVILRYAVPAQPSDLLRHAVFVRRFIHTLSAAANV